MCMKSFQTAGIRQTALVAISPLTVSIPAHAQCLLNSVQEELQDGGNDVDDSDDNGGHPALSRTRNAYKVIFMNMYQ
jgi:hypothetical protein